MKSNLTFLLILLILSSLFTGAHLKGWVSLFEFEIMMFFSLSNNSSVKFVYEALGMIIGISHICVIALPFIVDKSYFKKMLMIAPPLYVASFSVISWYLILVLMPFIVIWLFALRLAIKYTRQISDNEYDT